jgi:hypothetical protein
MVRPEPERLSGLGEPLLAHRETSSTLNVSFATSIPGYVAGGLFTDMTVLSELSRGIERVPGLTLERASSMQDRVTIYRLDTILGDFCLSQFGRRKSHRLPTFRWSTGGILRGMFFPRGVRT